MRTAASVTPEGTLRIYETTRLDAWLAKRKGQRIELELRTEAQIRSSQQNRYWHGVVVSTVADLWEREGVRMRTAGGVVIPLPKEAVHDALVTAFGGGVVTTPLGRARRKSTTQMTVEEFSGLIDAVRDYALQKYGSVIPTPEEWSE